MERSLALQRAQRLAWDLLLNGVGEIPKTPGDKIGMPSMMRQELPFENTVSRYEFTFDANAPKKTLVLNNLKFGENDVFGIYGFRIAIGVGAAANNRVYRSVGTTANDDSVYNGALSLDLESTTPIFNMATEAFRDERDETGWSGLVLINPQRIVTGKMAKIQLNLDLGNISGLVLTADQFISVEMHGALGRA